MRNAIKNTAAILLVFAALIAVICIAIGEPPKGMTSIKPILIPALAVGIPSLVVLVVLSMQKDLAPDYLKPVAPKFFERDGFCFALLPAVREGKFCIDVYYQSRYLSASQAIVIVKPMRGFLRTAAMQAIQLSIDCPPAGFGLLSLPLPVPAMYQGTRQTFDLWCSAQYPAGRGKAVRYREGLSVGAAPASAWRAPALVLAGAMVGMIVLPGRPARITLQLPSGVADDFPDNAPIIRETIWKWGDPPLPTAATRV